MPTTPKDDADVPFTPCPDFEEPDKPKPDDDIPETPAPLVEFVPMRHAATVLHEVVVAAAVPAENENAATLRAA